MTDISSDYDLNFSELIVDDDDRICNGIDCQNLASEPVAIEGFQDFIFCKKCAKSFREDVK